MCDAFVKGSFRTAIVFHSHLADILYKPALSTVLTFLSKSFSMIGKSGFDDWQNTFTDLFHYLCLRVCLVETPLQTSLICALESLYELCLIEVYPPSLHMRL